MTSLELATLRSKYGGMFIIGKMLVLLSYLPRAEVKWVIRRLAALLQVQGVEA